MDGGRSVRRKPKDWPSSSRSEEHTSELQSPCNLVCRLLLEKKTEKPAARSLGASGSGPCTHGLCDGVAVPPPSASRLDPPPSLRVCSVLLLFFFFFNDTAPPEIYTLSLHDALPI